MHDYLLSSEWVRFAFVLGVAVSMVLYERRHLTTGSIVVPGYIAVFMIHPLVILATFANALITYWLVNVILRRFFLLYGRTKFTILAAISTVIQTAMLRTTPRGEWLWESDIPLLIGVGYVVPALIAHDMARQGLWKTSKSVLLAGGLVASPIAVALVLDLPGVNDLAPLDGFGSTAIAGKWLPLAVLLSVFASWAVARNYGLRSGGFVGAAFIGMFMADPWQVAAAAASATLTYLIVTRVLMNSMILFGRRKFSAMLLVSSLLSWTTLWFGARFLDAEWQSHLSLGSLALTPLLLPGLLANDAQRTAPSKVVFGVALGGSFVLTTTWWVQSIVTGAVLHPGWKLISVATAAAAFWPQLVVVAGHVRSIASGRRRRGAAGEPQPVPSAASAVAAGGGSMSISWSSWAAAHPLEADRALAWLDAQLAAPAPAPALPGATAPTSMLDDITMGALETALASDRGIAPVPRRRRRSPLAALPTVRPHWAEISETSGGAREAPSAPPDVSGERPVTENIGPGTA